MNKKLGDLDCIVRPVCLSKHLVDPYNYSQIVSYPEEFMIMEYAKYGSLHELLQFTKSFNEITASSIFYHILHALKQIHAKGVAHMDIKENNILITHCDANQQNPLTGFLPIAFKLADFGISLSLSNSNITQVFHINL